MKQGQGPTWLCVVHDFNISVGLRGFSRDVPIPNGDFFSDIWPPYPVEIRI